jgi:hypothetical protein
MKKKRVRERGALDLIEAAVHLLRSCPASAAGWYCLGTLPFLLALLYFWADMSRGAFAEEHANEAALGLAVLFAWMKFGQAIFAAQLRGVLTQGDAVPFTWRQRARLALFQAIVQPSKLFVLPIAALITLPFARAVAFYENVTAFGAAENVSSLIRNAGRQAKLWPRQNHLVLVLLLLFAFFAFCNLALLLLMAPHLFKMLTGVESIFTRSGMNVLNTTFLAVIGALTYLCCDPLTKAVYVLRCFYGEALRSGEDLRVELRLSALRESRLIAIVVAFALLGAVQSTRAEKAGAPAVAVQPAELDRSISDTINRPEFGWRMAREKVEPAAPENSSFLAAVGRWTKTILKKIGKGISDLMEWINRHLSRRPPGTDSRSPGELKSGLAGSSRTLLIACLILVAAAALFLLVRVIRQRRAKMDDLEAQPVAAAKVDLADEAVTADQLPEDEWLALARTLIGQKEFRLALRALFLAGLAHLASRQVILLAKHKSNRDYAVELRRRAAEQVALQQAFSQNMVQVERAWYGLHEVTAEMVDRFNANLEQIRAC